MLMLSEGKYLANGILHLWLTVAALLCVLCYDCHKKQIIFLQTIEINYNFLLFWVVVYAFWYVISCDILIRKCCTYVVQAVLMPLSMVLKLHTLGFWYPCRKATARKPEGTQHVQKPEFRWFESVGEDLRYMSMRNWRCTVRHRAESCGGRFGRGCD